jgi:hypothetical protein
VTTEALFCRGCMVVCFLGLRDRAASRWVIGVRIRRAECGGGWRRGWRVHACMLDVGGLAVGGLGCGWLPVAVNGVGEACEESVSEGRLALDRDHGEVAKDPP